MEIYDSETGQCVGEVLAGDDVHSLAINEENSVVATGLASGCIEIWKVFNSPENIVDYAFENIPSISEM